MCRLAVKYPTAVKVNGHPNQRAQKKLQKTIYSRLPLLKLSQDAINIRELKGKVGTWLTQKSAQWLCSVSPVVVNVSML